MNRTLTTIFLLALMLAFASIAAAHAALDHALPAPGSSLREAPPQLQLWFTQRIEPAFSTVEVTDEHGQRVDNRDSRVEAAEGKLLSVSLAHLQPGRYRVAWRVVSVDTHVSKGDFTFDVAR